MEWVEWMDGWADNNAVCDVTRGWMAERTSFVAHRQVANGLSIRFLRAIQRELRRTEPKAEKLTTDDVVNMYVRARA